MEVFTLKEASEYLSLHPEVLRKKAAAGDIPGKKIGRGTKSPWRFMQKDLDRYLSKSGADSPASLDPSVQSLIETLQTSDDLEKITHAIQVLGIQGFEESVKWIVPFIESPFEEIQAQAVGSLISILGSESRSIVYPFLDKDVSPLVKIPIARFFSKEEGDEKSTQYLVSIFQDTDQDMYRRMVVYRLLETHPGMVLTYIRADLHSDRTAVRYRAVMGLWKTKYEGIEDDLRILLNDRVEKIRLKTIEIIGLSGLKSMLPELLGIVTGRDPDHVKQQAALATTRIFGYPG